MADEQGVSAFVAAVHAGLDVLDDPRWRGLVERAFRGRGMGSSLFDAMPRDCDTANRYHNAVDPPERLSPCAS